MYGFNHEPLAVFERASISGAAPTTLSRIKTFALIGPPLELCDASIALPATAVTCYIGDAISFEGTSSNGTSWTWDFKDTTTAQTKLASHAWTAAGTYAVSFTARASGFRPGTATVTITVLTPSVAISVSPGVATLLTGATATFTSSVTGTTNLGVSWTASAGSLSSTTAQSVTYTAPSTPGTYTITVTSQADPTKTATATVTVNAPVGITLDKGTATVATNGSTTFQATVTGTTNTAVTWSLTSGGGTLSSTTANPVTFTAPGTAGTYTLTATSVADPTKTASATLTVTSAVVITLDKSAATLATGTSTTFQATVAGTTNTGVTWSLISGGGTLSSSTVNPVTFTAPGTAGTVVLRATSQTDSTKVVEATITVVAGVVINLNKTTATVATGASTTFQATVTGTTSTAVTWSIQSGGGRLNSTTLNPVTFTAPGTAQAVVLRATSVADSTKFTQATISVVSGVVISVNPTSLTLMPGQSTSLTATVSGTTNLGVNWSASGGAFGSATANPATYTAPATVGSYTITVQSQSDPAKVAVVAVTVSTVARPVIQNFQAMPSTISSGGSSTLTWSVSNVTSVTISGITGSQAASGSLSVSPTATTPYTLTATNAAGTATSSVQVTVLGPLTATRILHPDGVLHSFRFTHHPR